MDYIREAEDIFRHYTRDKQDSWIAHSRNVATAAQKIALKCGLDYQRAYSYGLLHDIGRSMTKGQFRHIMLGYEVMLQKGYNDVARICLTHSFPIQDIYSYVGELDIEKGEIEKYQEIIQSYSYDDYDLLIQLCDAVSTDIGYIYLEKRFVNNVFKYGFNDYTIAKWKKTIEIKDYFEEKIGNIYEVLS